MRYTMLEPISFKNNSVLQASDCDIPGKNQL
jgi:hypothetical protein